MRKSDNIKQFIKRLVYAIKINKQPQKVSVNNHRFNKELEKTMGIFSYDETKLCDLLI